MSILDTLLIVTALTAALWWAVARHQLRAVLEALSFAAALLAVVTLEDMHWQLVPWQGLAVTVAAAGPRRARGAGAPRGRGRGGRPRRWRRVIARCLLVPVLAAMTATTGDAIAAFVGTSFA